MVRPASLARWHEVYSTPPGLVGAEVWARADGDELVVVADLAGLPLRPDWAGAGPLGLAEVARHRLSVPGNPRIDLGHYPGHPQQPGFEAGNLIDEVGFTALWLRLGRPQARRC